MPPSGANNGQTTAIAVEIDDTGNGSAATFDASYELGGEDISVGAYTFYPSVVVDANNYAYVGMSVCNSDMFAGAYVVGIDGSTGIIGATLTAQAGVDDYVRTFGGDNRWGDYSNTRIDPSDGSIWTIHKTVIANGNPTTGGEDGQWQAYMVNFAPSEFTLPVELLEFYAIADEEDALLKWTTATEVDNKGFEVQEMIEGTFRTIGFVNGVGTTFLQKKYEYSVLNLSHGQHTFRLRQVDFDNSGAYSSVATVFIRTNDLYVLSEPSPTVFNIRTEFELTVGTSQNIEVSVYDIYGRKFVRVILQKLSSRYCAASAVDFQLCRFQQVKNNRIFYLFATRKKGSPFWTSLTKELSLINQIATSK